MSENEEGVEKINFKHFSILSLMSSTPKIFVDLYRSVVLFIKPNTIPKKNEFLYIQEINQVNLCFLKYVTITLRLLLTDLLCSYSTNNRTLLFDQNQQQNAKKSIFDRAYPLYLHLTHL